MTAQSTEMSRGLEGEHHKVQSLSNKCEDKPKTNAATYAWGLIGWVGLLVDPWPF